MRTFAMAETVIDPSQSPCVTHPLQTTSNPSEQPNIEPQKTKEEESVAHLRTSLTISSNKERSPSATNKPKRSASPLENPRRKNCCPNDRGSTNGPCQEDNSIKELEHLQEATVCETTRQNSEIVVWSQAPLHKQSSTHTSTPPRHTCVICGKCFKRAHNLKIHGRMHNTERPYKCPFANCVKDFRWKSSFVSHVNWHRTKKGHRLPPDTILSRLNRSKRQKNLSHAETGEKEAQQKSPNSQRKEDPRQISQRQKEKPLPFSADQQSHVHEKINSFAFRHSHTPKRQLQTEPRLKKKQHPSKPHEVHYHRNENTRKIQTQDETAVLKDRPEPRQHAELGPQLKAEYETKDSLQQQVYLQSNRHEQTPTHGWSNQQQSEWIEKHPKDMNQRQILDIFHHSDRQVQSQYRILSHLKNQTFAKCQFQKTKQHELQHPKWQQLTHLQQNRVDHLQNTCGMIQQSQQQHLQNNRSLLLWHNERQIREENEQKRREGGSESQNVFDCPCSDNLGPYEFEASRNRSFRIQEGELHEHEAKSQQLFPSRQADLERPQNITVITEDHTSKNSANTIYGVFQAPSEASISDCPPQIGSTLLDIDTRQEAPMQLMSSEDVANDPDWNLEFNDGIYQENEQLDRLFAELEKAGSMVEAKGGLSTEKEKTQPRETDTSLTPMNSPGIGQDIDENKTISSSRVLSPGTRSRSTVSSSRSQDGIIDWIMKLGEYGIKEDPSIQTPSTTESLEIITGGALRECDGTSPCENENECGSRRNENPISINCSTGSLHITTEGHDILLGNMFDA